MQSFPRLLDRGTPWEILTGLVFRKKALQAILAGIANGEEQVFLAQPFLLCPAN